MIRFFNKTFRDILPWIFAVLCALSLLLALSMARKPGDTDSAARKLERTVGRRMSLLESYAGKALHESSGEWLNLKNLPEDMVIYRYVGDTLKSWVNTFPIANDDISNRYVLNVFSNPRNEVSSGLLNVTPEVKFMNLGSKWYLTKSFSEGNVTVIAGLEVLNHLSESTYKGVNPRFKLDDKYSIRPLAFSCGSAVVIEGRPQFKVLYDSLQSYLVLDSVPLLLALAFFFCAIFSYLISHKSLKNCLWCIVLSAIVSAAVYMWGLFIQGRVKLFSPGLYADGPFFYSLGVVLLVNFFIFVTVCSVYIVKRNLLEYMYGGNARLRTTTVSVCCLLLIVAVLVFICWTFRSIVLNSGICLELYRLDRLSIYTALVYVSNISVLMTIPMLLQLLRPWLKMSFGIKFHPLSRMGRTIVSALIAVFLVVISSLLGFRKEQSRVEAWSNRLSVDRDITLELHLRSVENAIASDVILGSLTMLDNSASLISNRLSDGYFYRISQDYDIMVFLLTPSNVTPQSLEFFNGKAMAGSAIAPKSYFRYSDTGTGHTKYTGLFIYQNPKFGTTSMLIEVEPKANREDRGYAKLLGRTMPGRVMLPSKYSYARYNSLDLLSFKGTYAYPTRLNDGFYADVAAGARGSFVKNGYRHFVTNVSEDEMVVISRPKVALFHFFLAVVFLSLVCYFSISIVTRRKTPQSKRRHYYRNRVITVFVLSLFITLVTLATVSVLFVYGRNESNRRTMMSDRAGAIQSVAEKFCHNAKTYKDLGSQDFFIALEEASNIIRADITLYTPEGVEFHTTMPEIFESRVLGSRINSEAYENVVFGTKRYYLHSENVGKVTMQALYVPVFNDSGQMIAILSSPYTEDNFDFELEAVMHLVTVILVFAVLLIFMRFLIEKIVDRIFKPLSEMDKKMNTNSVDTLEHIEYKGEDEITSLVSSYNRMVTDLSESTAKLARAERDKAWSAMARQVAHEIKNPLTPMKLQVQRIIRLKEKNAPGWEERFDEASRIILDHIDVLSQTANDFSTFAKLYTEDPIELNLDEMLQQEVAMFDNHESIDLSYIGFADAVAVGPKPQLTRVFVNLITNAIQAVEAARQEDVAQDREPRRGKVVISLRNSSVKDGFFDIVFEDNGDGVSEENMQKLFTPNFTTKSSGTGLGLAISKSILEKSGAEISYSRSFVLGGACFTIVFPKGVR